MSLTDQRNAASDQVNAFLKASITKDVAFMEENLHDDFLFTTPRGTLFDFNSFFSGFLENPAISIEVFELVSHRVNLIAGIALVI